jgi:NAD-dependent deacetylase
MADMERMGRLAHVITQNVDNLSWLAGSRSITEIHGNRFLARCMSCGTREALDRIAFDRLPPTCPECGGVMKNDTVMFGEPIPEDALQRCYQEAVLADTFLVIGTSAVVYPAADFPLMARKRGAPLIEVNPEETVLTELADVVLRAPAGVALPRLVEFLEGASGLSSGRMA